MKTQPGNYTNNVDVTEELLGKTDTNFKVLCGAG